MSGRIAITRARLQDCELDDLLLPFQWGFAKNRAVFFGRAFTDCCVRVGGGQALALFLNDGRNGAERFMGLRQAARPLAGRAREGLRMAKR